MSAVPGIYGIDADKKAHRAVEKASERNLPPDERRGIYPVVTDQDGSVLIGVADTGGTVEGIDSWLIEYADNDRDAFESEPRKLRICPVFAVVFAACIAIASIVILSGIK